MVFSRPLVLVELLTHFSKPHVVNLNFFLSLMSTLVLSLQVSLGGLGQLSFHELTELILPKLR